MLATTAAVLVTTGTGVAHAAPEADLQPQPRTQLVVATDLGGTGTWERFVLTCGPTGGDHPVARAACAALDTRQGRAALAPVPPGTLCTDQWGGPQVAHVRGYVDGRRVASSFDRTNGCEIHRWDALAPLLDVPVAVGPPAKLTVTLYPAGTGRSHQATLTCNPTGGTHPQAEAACSALFGPGGIEALRPVPPDVLCTQQWDGPEVARVEGRIGEREVTSTFSRHNGCEIGRWNTVAPVLELVPVRPGPAPVDR